MPAFEWVHVQRHQQKGMISLSPPTICNSASRKGAHYLLQTRTAVLNNELQDKFVCWYPGFQSDGKGPAMAA
ncbi:hypothetical protein EXX01_24215 [Escherichia coli]|nr:hypothetical protein EXX01_24215 [Escherichia coli]